MAKDKERKRTTIDYTDLDLEDLEDLIEGVDLSILPPSAQIKVLAARQLKTLRAQKQQRESEEK